MDEVLSKRIEVLRFSLIVGIVFIHMYTNDIHFSGTVQDHNLFAMFVEYVSNILARVSVPLFFAMSGYLFFLSFDGSFANYKKKMHSRFHTLLIPFLFWNAIVFLFFAIAQNLPQTAHYFNGERPLVLSYGFLDQLALFFGLGKFEYPVAYQFWFIRDLIILVIISPLLYILLRKIPWFVLGSLFLAWVFLPPHPDLTSYFYFTLGAYLGIRHITFQKTVTYAPFVIGIYVVLSFVSLFSEERYIDNVVILWGTFAAFCLSYYIVQNEKISQKLIQLAKYSFFVFAVHEPLLSIVRKISFKVVSPQSDWSVLGLYFFAPIVTIVSAIVLYEILARLAPGILKIATGNRI